MHKEGVIYEEVWPLFLFIRLSLGNYYRWILAYLDFRKRNAEKKIIKPNKLKKPKIAQAFRHKRSSFGFSYVVKWEDNYEDGPLDGVH